MHEFGIVQNIIEVLEETAKKEKLKSISEINLQIGEILQIVPETLQFAFESVTKNTKFEAAKINIEKMPIKIKCNSCRKKLNIENNFYICTECGSSDLEIISGNELLIKSIEGE